jgi:hypothetical protein
MGFYRGPQIIRDGLVMYLDAANTKSYPGNGNIISDIIGTNTGEFINGPVFNISNNGYISFDGVNDYIQGSSSNVLTLGLSDFTISHWFYINAFTGQATTPTVLDLRTTFSENGYSDYVLNNKFKVYYGQSNRYTSIANIFTGIWYNIAVTRNGSINSIYINGVLDGSYTNAFNFTEGGYKIGRNINTGASTSYLNGRVATLMIYKERYLNANEVAQNYNALKNRFL